MQQFGKGEEGGVKMRLQCWCVDLRFGDVDGTQWILCKKRDF